MKIVSESPDRANGVCPKRQTPRVLAGVLAVAMLATAWAGASRARAEDPPPPTPPEKTAATFRLPPGFQIRLVASEPHLANPISMANY